MNELREIQRWFQSQCNEVWEHSRGIRIETVDNPGWWVHIDLQGTALADKPFTPVAHGLSADKVDPEADWLCCEVRDHVFDAAGDPAKLETILRIFLGWAKSK
jgi:hypothetical protein